MPDPSPTISELWKANTVVDEQIGAAVDAVLADVAPDAYPIADGYVLDLPAAMKAHAPTAKALADANASETFKRGMVRTAILLARPVKA